MSDEQTRALVPRGEVGLASTRPPDDYERKFMRGKGLMLARDKARMPRALSAMIGAAALGAAGAALAGGGALIGGLLAAGALTFTWLSMSVLRVAVSEGVVHVQYGLFGPEIPVAAIEHAERYEYKWIQYGGWGIRRGWNGEWMYNVPGDEGHAVRIVWRDAKGRRRTTCIGSKNADTIFAAIQKARMAIGEGHRPALKP
jgi:hypothetical protein